MPEPRGRSFAELDLLFEQGVPARKFASTQVDVFDTTVEGSVINDYERKASVGRYATVEDAQMEGHYNEKL